MAKEHDLSKEECDQLRNGNEVYVEHIDARIIIEEQTLNAFCIWTFKSFLVKQDYTQKNCQLV